MAPGTKRTSSGTMKQGTLSFAAKRTGSGPSASTAKSGKKTIGGNASPSVKVATPKPTTATIEVDSSEGEDDLLEEYISSEDELPMTVSTEQKKKLKGTKPKSEVVNSGDGLENATAAETAEDVKDEVQEPVMREKLNMDDKKWNKQYGLARVKMGNLKPVHCEGDKKVHHILRVFDMSYEYGPFIGVTRLERWERANALGLNPPPEIKEILITEQGVNDKKIRESALYGMV
ncbi:uncharacterized protein STEHIDRAFT_150559 [Stereum hirsutum FP-91666 SS1]|uniref:DNA polymerase delta subunit 4 n=1 Tax=Stereum hirsutum (strain FP-91666) TaxID=721885 RepID=R7S1A9_STEHR|nr:uncharacterized protein STEHIDRAFT_150559 [Stereum hirsutum FP-91666 SS1]EIM80352.1 hypothetical protein STEHIDRAFT_150559 [Stereum hirsutum FP-91666 SS1]